jgi:PmbA protein
MYFVCGWRLNKMIKELYKEVIRETSLNVSENRIDSVRKKALTKCGCRIYKDGLIGVAGCYGEATPDTWEKAEENLANGIPYPYEPERNKERIRDLREINVSDEQFIRDMENLLDILKNEYPQFIFSNKIQLTETETSLTNDAGLKLINYDKTLIIMLLVKHIDSVNILDTSAILISRKYGLDKFLKETRQLLDGYGRAAAIPDKKEVPVILCQMDMLGKFTESLNGESLALGSSMFEGRLQSKAFNEAFLPADLCSKR